MTAMEPPVGLDADSVRDEKGKLLKSVRPVASEEVAAAAVRGQYGPGRMDGQKVPGYREEPGVAKNSTTPTYAAIRFFIDNWRWEGVPFYLRSGKHLPKRVTEVAIEFKRPPLLLFKSHAVENVNPNVLVMRIQPDEGVSLTFEVKPPGHDMSGIARIALFDADGLECQVAAEIKNFAADKILQQQDARRVGRAVPLLLTAAREALQDAGICSHFLTREEKQSWGVVIGSGGGAADFTEEQYRRYFSDQLRRVSAYNVSSSTPGGLSSELSLSCDFRGPSHLISTGCTSSTDALGYAFNMIRFGLAEHLVSGGVDATITPGVMAS